MSSVWFELRYYDISTLATTVLTARSQGPPTEANTVFYNDINVVNVYY